MYYLKLNRVECIVKFFATMRLILVIDQAKKGLKSLRMYIRIYFSVVTR